MTNLLWVNLILGLWLVASPWVVKAQGASTASRLNAVVSGIGVFMLSGAVLLAQGLVR